MPSDDAATPDVMPDVPKNHGTGQVAHMHKLMMLVATLARMGVGLVTFLILARYLGPEKFGVIATAIAVSGVVSIVSDYGLAISALRLASADPARADEIVTRALAVKLLLTAVASVLCLIGAVVLLPPQDLGTYALAFLGVYAYAFADLVMVAVRSRQRFEVEAILVVATSIVILIVVGGVAAYTRDLFATALAFAATRVFYLIASLVTVRKVLAIRVGFVCRLADVGSVLRSSSGYALDAILTVLSSQVDVLLFAALVSMHDMGIYQAGTRLVQAILPFAAILATVYMPTLSAAALQGDDETFRRNSRRINLEFSALSIVGGLGFAFLGPVVTHFIYGASYAPLNPLWTGFGIFVAFRLMASSYGIQLAAVGFVRERIAASVASIAVFCVVALLLVPRHGLGVTSWMLALSGVPSILILGVSLARDRRTDASVWMTGLATFLLAAFLALY